MKDTVKGITGRHTVCGVIGNPIEHTLSPIIHNAIADKLKKQHIYVPFLVTEDQLEAAIRGAHALGIKGLNVTMPHKQAIIPCLTSLDETAVRVGAVNTLVAEESGYRGYNTDATGLSLALEEAGFSYKDQVVAIIGSGGAAYAAVMATIEDAKSIYLFNRTKEHAVRLKEHIEKIDSELVAKITLHSLEETPLEQAYLVIQTTGVGMGRLENQMPSCSEMLLAKATYAVDMIYNPWETLFLKTAKGKGVKVINGFGMLFFQALKAYELMHSIHCPLAVAYEIKREIEKVL